MMVSNSHTKWLPSHSCGQVHQAHSSLQKLTLPEHQGQLSLYFRVLLQLISPLPARTQQAMAFSTLWKIFSAKYSQKPSLKITDSNAPCPALFLSETPPDNTFHIHVSRNMLFNVHTLRQQTLSIQHSSSLSNVIRIPFNTSVSTHSLSSSRFQFNSQHGWRDQTL